MFRFKFLLILLFFIQACYYTNDKHDYSIENKRFNYTSIEYFKSSIVNHFNNDINKFDKNKLEELEVSVLNKNDINLYLDNNHEDLIEKYPSKIFKYILYLKDNKSSEKIIFESMQTYLRYLTKNKTIR